MATGLNSVPTVCTGYQIAGFTYDQNHLPTSDDLLRKELEQHLNISKVHLKVCVFALLTMQQSKNFPILEEFGFVRSFDAHNYKYPDSSRRLIMYTKDMNEWERTDLKPKVEVKQSNPFHVAIPTPSVIRDPEVTNPTMTNRTRSGELEYTHSRHQDAIRRVALNRFISGGAREFPVGQWVDVPRNNTQCPDYLRDKRCEAIYWNANTNSFLLSNSRGRDWSWGGYTAGHWLARVRILA